MAKKKTTKRKRTQTKKQPKKGVFSLLPFLFKWGLIAFVWGSVALLFTVFVYTYDLPDINQAMKFEKKPAVTILAADHSVLTRYGESQGKFIKAQDAPPHLINAILATEDRRFYSHFGIDPLGLARAMAANVMAGRFIQGGSTITQQLSKILFLTPERTLERKIKEALTALWLEMNYSKDEILTAYLNRVYLGSGTYGFDAASQRYFHKSVIAVNTYEAALLAGLLKAPSRYSPLSNPDLAAKRTNVVLNAMVDAGFLTDKGKQDVLRTKGNIVQERRATPDHLYFTNWILDQVQAYAANDNSDLIVYTTYDPSIQAQTSRALSETIKQHGEGRSFTQGAALVLSKTGAVRAMSGGVNYRTSQFNRATQAMRQPGSAFKPIIYLTAFEKLGLDIDDTVTDEKKSYGEYTPENFNKEYLGDIPLSTAFAKSLNTVAVRLAYESGIGSVIQNARLLGLTTPLNHDLSLALGSSEVSMIELTSAYATISNDGHSVTPYGILKIQTLGGDILFEKQFNEAPRLFKKRNIEKLKTVMQKTVEQGTGRNAAIPGQIIGGKTGTSENYRDAWFIGFNGNYVAAVWLGNDDNSPMQGVTGGSYPARIWKQIIKNIDPAPTYLEHETRKEQESFFDRFLNFFND